MHGDPQHGGSVSTISIGDLELTSVDHEAQPAQQPEGTEDGLRIEEDQRGRNGHPASSRNARDDTGGFGGHQGDLFGSADSDGGEGLHGRLPNPEHVEVQQLGEGNEPARNQISFFHVPALALERALGLGAGHDIEKVIIATDEQTVHEVQRRLLDGSQQFWAATQHGEFIGCLITEIASRETNDVLMIRYMAGKSPQTWLPVATEVLMPMAQDAGLDGVYADTREGMRKFLISQGWRKVSIRMRLDLPDGRKN